jgi:hypothetical protein
MEDHCRDWWAQEYQGKKDTRPEGNISDFEVCLLGKELLSRTKQETSSTAMAELPRKRSRHYRLSIRSSGGIAINLCMGLYPRWLPSANGPSAVPKSSLPPERNALSDATIEASECLKAWWDQGLITQN